MQAYKKTVRRAGSQQCRRIRDGKPGPKRQRPPSRKRAVVLAAAFQAESGNLRVVLQLSL